MVLVNFPDDDYGDVNADSSTIIGILRSRIQYASPSSVLSLSFVQLTCNDVILNDDNRSLGSYSLGNLDDCVIVVSEGGDCRNNNSDRDNSGMILRSSDDGDFINAYDDDDNDDNDVDEDTKNNDDVISPYEDECEEEIYTPGTQQVNAASIQGNNDTNPSTNQSTSKNKKRNKKKRNEKKLRVVKVEESSDDESVEYKFTEDDIELIMNQTSCLRDRAVAAFQDNQGDLFNTIMRLNAENLNPLRQSLLRQAAMLNNSVTRDVTTTATLRDVQADPKDVELVMSQASCSRVCAIKALKDNYGDIVHAIMSLTVDVLDNTNDEGSLPPLLSDDDDDDDESDGNDDNGSLPPLLSDEYEDDDDDDDNSDDDNDDHMIREMIVQNGGTLEINGSYFRSRSNDSVHMYTTPEVYPKINNSDNEVIFVDDPNRNDDDNLITVRFIAGMSDRSMPICKSTPLCVIFSDYRRLENILPSTDLHFVVGEWGEVASECDATAIDLGIEGGDVIMVVGPEQSQQHTQEAPARSAPQAAAAGGIPAAPTDVLDFSNLLSPNADTTTPEGSGRDHDDYAIFDLTSHDNDDDPTGRIVLQLKESTGEVLRFVVDENITPLSKIFRSYRLLRMGDAPSANDGLTVGATRPGQSLQFSHKELGMIPLECIATASQLGIKDGDTLVAMFVVEAAQDRGGSAFNLGTAVSEAAALYGNENGSTIDLTKNSNVVIESIIISLKEPGDEATKFRIDRQATSLPLIFIEYADTLGGVALDSLRFILGGRRLPRDSDETAYDNGIVNEDTIHVLRVRHDRPAANRNSNEMIGITLLNVLTNDTEFFLVEPLATFRKIFEKYAQSRLNTPVFSLRFLYGDCTIYADDTPSSVGIRFGDIVHVFIKSNRDANCNDLELTPNSIRTMRSARMALSFDPHVRILELERFKLNPSGYGVDVHGKEIPDFDRENMTMMIVSDGKQQMNFHCSGIITNLVDAGVILQNAIIQINDFRVVTSSRNGKTFHLIDIDHDTRIPQWVIELSEQQQIKRTSELRAKVILARNIIADFVLRYHERRKERKRKASIIVGEYVLRWNERRKERKLLAGKVVGDFFLRWNERRKERILLSRKIIDDFMWFNIAARRRRKLVMLATWVQKFHRGHSARFINSDAVQQRKSDFYRFDSMWKKAIAYVPNQDKFCSGYILTLYLVSDTERTKDLVLAFVRRYIYENATIGHEKNNTIHIHIPQVVKIVNIFYALNAKTVASKSLINQFVVSRNKLVSMPPPSQSGTLSGWTLVREKIDLKKVELLDDDGNFVERDQKLDEALTGAMQEDDNTNTVSEEEVVKEDEDNTNDDKGFDEKVPLALDWSKFKVSSHVVKSIKNIDKKFREIFVARMRQLASGARSHKLMKPLKGCVSIIYETYMDNSKGGFRILWTQERGDIVVWFIAKRKDVSRFAKLIDDARNRTARQQLPQDFISELDSDRMAPRSEVMLDALGNVPMKLYDVTKDHMDDIISNPSWMPQMHLTEEERSVVEAKGTILLLGRSGTGKTICISNRIEYDRQIFGHNVNFSQLFLARSSRLCKYVEGAVGANKNTSFITFNELLRDLTQVESKLYQGNKSTFSQAKHVDFARFKTLFYSQCNQREKASALMVWKSIRTFLKGSIEAYQTDGVGYLTREYFVNGESFQATSGLEVEKLGKDRCKMTPEQRIVAYDIFLQYQCWLNEEKRWDDCDRILFLLRNIDPRTGDPESYDHLKRSKIYVDEVQDYLQVEILLFFYLGGGPKSLFLAGDPAQSVVEGTDFRFDEVRSVGWFVAKGNRNLIPDKPRVVNVNFRSHAGILNCAGGILDLLFGHFENTVKQLPKDYGLFKGARPGVFHNVDVQKLSTLLKEKLPGAVVLTHDDSAPMWREKLDRRLVYGIREAKGLEFKTVILLDFFCEIESSLQKPWRDLLLNRAKSDHEFATKYPLVETHLKLMYTGVTRCIEQLFFAETTSSDAGNAAVRWLTTKTKDHADGEALATKNDVTELESMTMTNDEFQIMGIENAEQAESSSIELNQAMEYLRNAVYCFDMADSPRLKAKAEAHLKSLELRLKVISTTDDDYVSVENEAAEVVEQLLREDLLSETVSLINDITGFFPKYTQVKLEDEITTKLNRIITYNS